MTRPQGRLAVMEADTAQSESLALDGLPEFSVGGAMAQGELRFCLRSRTEDI